MRKSHNTLVLLAALAMLLHGCAFKRTSILTLDDFKFLKKGMKYQQVVEILGEPNDRMHKSTAFVIYVYELKTGEQVNMGFFPEADYLDSAYLFNEDGEEEQTLVSSSLSFPSGLIRNLTLSDFEGLAAGMQYFFDVYYQVGPPNLSGTIEGGRTSLIYYLNDGGRISMHSDYLYGCINRIGYSPESFGSSGTTLSEDTQGLCAEK